MKQAKDTREIIPLVELGRENVDIVGGKSSSLGEMIQNLSSKKVPVPGGFSTTTQAYRNFFEENCLQTKINELLARTDVHDASALAEAGKIIRSWVMESDFSERFIQLVNQHITILAKAGIRSVAIRSSATAEDLPDASFAGQQETFLNVPTKLKPVLIAIKKVIASLYGDRAIFYREDAGYEHEKVALCVSIQHMVKSEVAGVMFTSDSESGHTGVIGITAVWGLGELAVGGANTDEYIVGKPVRQNGPVSILQRAIGSLHEKMVFSTPQESEEGHFTKKIPLTLQERSRFCLSDKDLEELASFAMTIENHYGHPVDIEWGKDKDTGLIHILQARPITVNRDVGKFIETYKLNQGQHKKIARGLAVGRRIGSGIVRVLKDSSPEELEKVGDGDILVAKTTDPNFAPAMRRASAIVTKEGSRQCHAAIVAREMRIPAIVACEDALTRLHDGMVITVCCAKGTNGTVYEGSIPFNIKKTRIGNLPEIPVDIKMNVGDPSEALQASMFPNKGVGLARQEFIILEIVGIHPKACLEYSSLPVDIKKQIDARTVGYKNKPLFYKRKLAEGIAMIARAFYPHRVIIRLSDFKTNEYQELIGGHHYEPVEANPMLGFRGAARYLDKKFAACFKMECDALKIVRGQMGLTNLDIMVPFVRTLDEGRKVIALLAKNGLVSSAGEEGLRIGMMCELPSNVILAEQFAEIFDFASIGSNDLTQLTIGADRDSGCNFGDERNEAVILSIEQAIKAWRAAGKPIGICGQAPSDHKGYAERLAELGITSMSLNPDSVVPVWRRLGKLSEVS